MMTMRRRDTQTAHCGPDQTRQSGRWGRLLGLNAKVERNPNDLRSELIER